ncbi:hypothetical protein RHSIM_RhsimUnG0077400 [Rhododendron simsii]|uniref:Yippee domain-containing protein n=1 Tax=Rhododendron simsii TaxID=118357 RepID=A0A834FVI4_RHOSS|nr:hypothetical protein RHSIM_RhsimUnG0077400 [Rhododendron simsii]
MNIAVGPKEDRQLMTGLHTVPDVHCGDCCEIVDIVSKLVNVFLIYAFVSFLLRIAYKSLEVPVSLPE